MVQLATQDHASLFDADVDLSLREARVGEQLGFHIASSTSDAAQMLNRVIGTPRAASFSSGQRWAPWRRFCGYQGLMSEREGVDMYAHVNIWRLNLDGAATDNATAQAVAAHLERAAGFRSYTLVRTGDREVVAVTVFDSQHELEAAMRSVSEIVRSRVSPLVEGSPTMRSGEVLHHVTA